MGFTPVIVVMIGLSSQRLRRHEQAVHGTVAHIPRCNPFDVLLSDQTPDDACHGLLCWVVEHGSADRQGEGFPPTEVDARLTSLCRYVERRPTHLLEYGAL